MNSLILVLHLLQTDRSFDLISCINSACEAKDSHKIKLNHCCQSKTTGRPIEDNEISCCFRCVIISGKNISNQVGTENPINIVPLVGFEQGSRKWKILTNVLW